MPALAKTKIAQAVTAVEPYLSPQRLLVIGHDQQGNEITISVAFAEALDITITGGTLSTVDRNKIIAGLVTLLGGAV